MLGSKSPDARLDYGVDWTAVLEANDGDAILTAEWVNVTPGITLSDPQLQGNLHLAFFSGGESGRAYTATSRIVTSEGREDERTIAIFVRRT